MTVRVSTLFELWQFGSPAVSSKRRSPREGLRWKRIRIKFQMPQEDHSDLRSCFVDAHPDMVITTWNEPHRKFIEPINRDFMVNGTIPFYEVGEMRVRSDTISQKSGLAMSAEALLKLSKEDVLKDVVATEEEVVYRLNAFFMALEMHNICS